MKLAYGVMGYGRGHAMRSAAVLPDLMRRHEVRIFAGGDARAAMREQFDINPLPVIHYHYDDAGRISPWRTLQRNLRPGLDAMFGGPASRALDEALRHFQPDVVISDSETFTHRAARRLGIPRISFDHVGIMAYCKPILPDGNWLLGHRDGLAYRAFMGWPERVLISSFFPAIARRPDVEIIPPLMRDLVVRTPPGNSGHLLAYFNKGQHQYRPPVAACLKALNLPVKVYGTGRQGSDGNLQYQAFSQSGFVEDLAGAHAVLATAGSQLIGEALYLGKPLFLVPEDCFEQRLNAEMVRRMGLGTWSSLTALDADEIEEFLINDGGYRRRIEPHRRDGRAQALARLEEWISELADPEFATKELAT